MFEWSTRRNKERENPENLWEDRVEWTLRLRKMYIYIKIILKFYK